MPKLTQIIAVEKSLKTKVQQELDTAYKAIQKPVLFDGFAKNYKPIAEGDETQSLPPQTQRVQLKASEVLELFKARLSELFDVVAQKEYANTRATAIVEVDGETVAADVPVTYLLFLEKQLTDLHTVIEKLPTLDPAEDWKWDEARGLYATEAVKTQRTQKVQKAIVLYPATDKHPAQTQLINEDVVVGSWDQVKFSGRTTEEARRKLLLRIEKLQKAVKFAREAANLVEAPPQQASKILDWIFA